MGSDKKCNSTWMGRAATYGYLEKDLGYTFEGSMWPTFTSRVVANFDAVWKDLQHCVTLPPLSHKELESIKVQLLCHIVYGKPPHLGGDTWDFEARRKAIS